MKDVCGVENWFCSSLEHNQVLVDIEGEFFTVKR